MTWSLAFGLRAAGRMPELRLLYGGFALNLVWELLQTPLYSDADAGVRQLLFSRIHCSVGDVLILAGAWALTACLVGDLRWLRGARWGRVAVLAATGVAYTAWSEFFNVRLVGEWGYAPGMPLLFGIGLTPPLQWVILPPLLVWWSRRPLTQFAALSSAVHPPGAG